METTKLNAKNLKNALWKTLLDLKENKIEVG